MMLSFVEPAYRTKILSDLVASYIIDRIGSDYIKSVPLEALEREILKPVTPVASEYVDAGMHPDFVSMLYWFDRVQALIGCVPPRWLSDFSNAKACGAISDETLGAAARSIYLCYSPEDETWGQHHQAFLNAFREAPAMGLMAVTERAHVAELPDVVTLYRGSFAPDCTVAAQGLSWSRHPHYPSLHILRRVVSRRVKAASGKSYPIGKPNGRRAFLVTAKVPKYAVLAISHSGVRPGVSDVMMAAEILVDYERIDVRRLLNFQCPPKKLFSCRGF